MKAFQNAEYSYEQEFIETIVGENRDIQIRYLSSLDELKKILLITPNLLYFLCNELNIDFIDLLENSKQREYIF